MNNGGDAAEQVVRLSLEGFEVAARLSGSAAKNIALLLVSVLKQEQKTKGKARLTNMIKSGKELKVFTVKNGDLKKFTQEAKKYGVLYCVLADRGNKDPNAEVDVIARAEDASKISRIAERFKLASETTASIVTETEKSKDEKTGQPEPDIGVQEKAEKDKLLDEHIGKPCFALCFLFLVQNGIEENGDVLRTCACDFGCDLKSFQAHSDDLFCRFAACIHSSSAPFVVVLHLTVWWITFL